MTDIAPARTTPDTHAWRDDAACRGIGPEAFFPTEMNLTGARRAIAICDGCSVRLACLISAMHEEERTYGGRHGIRGGLTPTQRMQLAKGGPVKPIPATVSNGGRRKIADHGTDAGWYRHKRTTRDKPCEPCVEAHKAAGRNRPDRRQGSAA